MHTIIYICILYGFCMQIVYKMFMMYTFWYITIDVYKMHTKCLYKKCIPHFDKLLYTKCIQNVCMQNVYHISTNFCINFVIKNVAGMYTKCIQSLSTCGIHFVYIFVYILYTSVAYILYNQCIQNVNTVSVWESSEYA